jgi:hypothetical protein
VTFVREEADSDYHFALQESGSRGGDPVRRGQVRGR